MKLKNYYALLEILPQASTDEIKKAYRKLAKIWHPDKNSSSQASNQFQAIHEAYQTLQCPGKRKTYNLKFWKVFGKPASQKVAQKQASIDNDASGLATYHKNRERIFGKPSQKSNPKYEQWFKNEFMPKWSQRMQEMIQQNRKAKSFA